MNALVNERHIFYVPWKTTVFGKIMFSTSQSVALNLVWLVQRISHVVFCSDKSFVHLTCLYHYCVLIIYVLLVV